MIFDCNQATAKHIGKLFNTSFKHSFSLLRDAYAIRISQLHVLNCPPMVEKLISVVRPLMHEKVKKRVSGSGIWERCDSLRCCSSQFTETPTGWWRIFTRRCSRPTTAAIWKASGITWGCGRRSWWRIRTGFGRKKMWKSWGRRRRKSKGSSTT